MQNRSKVLSHFLIKLFAVALFFSTFIAETHAAVATACLEIAGNLDASSVILPVPGGAPTFAELSDAAQFSTFVEVRDSLLIAHTVTVYFFHTGANKWEIRGYVDAGEVGGVDGDPSVIGMTGISFAANGERVPPVPEVDFTATPAWSNGASADCIEFSFRAFTQYGEPSSVSSVLPSCPAGPVRPAKRLDFDFDGLDDYAIWRPQSGMWAVFLSNSNDLLWRQWGLPGDEPLPGDYNGDRKPDLVVWRPSNGNWYICSSQTDFDCSQGTVTQFGLPGDIPVQGDFDGDNILDLAVWRISEGAFYVRASSTGLVFVKQWGLPGDIPLK